MVFDNDAVAALFKDFVIDLLYVTARPHKGDIVLGILEVFENADKDEAMVFADRILNCIGYCRVKCKSATSFKKLDAAVAEICSVLSKLSDGDAARDFARSTSKLQNGAESPKRNMPRLRFARATAKKMSSPLGLSGLAKQNTLPRSSRKSSSSSSATRDCSNPEAILRSYGVHSKTCDDAVSVGSSVDCGASPDESPKLAKVAVKFTQYFDSGKLALVRSFADGTIVQAKMEEGPRCFALGFFEGESEGIETDMPNALLRPVISEKKVVARKRPDAATASIVQPKRAAVAANVAEEMLAEASEEVDAEESEEEEAAVDEVESVEEVAPNGRSYCKMYYKRNNSFGLREKFGDKKQILSICRKGKAKGKLEAIADEALAKLNSGNCLIQVARDWIKAKIALL